MTESVPMLKRLRLLAGALVLLAGGFAQAQNWPESMLRRAVRVGSVQVVRRTWFVTDAAPPDELAAARAGARVACVSLGGWHSHLDGLLS